MCGIPPAFSCPSGRSSGLIGEVYVGRSRFGAFGFNPAAGRLAERRPELVQQAALDALQGLLDIALRQGRVGGPEHEAHREALLPLADLGPAVEVKQADALDDALPRCP